MDEEREKLVGSLMFLRKGHLWMSSSEGAGSSLRPLKKKSIFIRNQDYLHKKRKEHKDKCLHHLMNMK
jgi:hypothetical protein